MTKPSACPTCGSNNKNVRFLIPAMPGELAYNRCSDPWHEPAQPPRNLFNELMEGVQAMKEKREAAPAQPPDVYWCCKADFGQHEPTCRNYKAEAAPSVDQLAKYFQSFFVDYEGPRMHIDGDVWIRLADAEKYANWRMGREDERGGK